MLKLLEGVKDYVKQKNFQTTTDGFVVRLFRITSVLILIFCVLVGGTQYLGDPIRCISGDSKKVPENVMNNYCFIMTTYTKPDSKPECRVGEHNARPGVGPSHPDDPDLTYHAYYQWVPLVLLLQMLTFTIPERFWERCEGGLIQKLMNSQTDMDVQKEAAKEIQEESEEKREEGKKKFRSRMELIAEYFVKSARTHQGLAFGWLATDILALLVAVLNYYATNLFLGANFSNFGLEVYNYFSYKERNDCYNPLDQVFPKLTKCHFRKFGPTGTIETIDSMCVMALNIINEKIYTMLWFWFLFLIAISIFGTIVKLIVWITLTCASKMELKAVQMMALLKFFGTPSHASSVDIRFLTRNLGFSDWILFALLTGNMTPYMYKEFAKHLSREKRNSEGLAFQESKI